ncbi:MAG: mechanosensitive ion channel family protein [Fibrobacter sp.]|nr:mechanosensitive ion channel family protein [Fibrobacter sp.]
MVNGEEIKRTNTLMRLLRQTVLVIIWVTIGLMMLKNIGFDIAPFLASAGVLSLALGFGAQNLVRDVISGLFLILENQVRVGDTLMVGEVMGVVERISMRTTSVRDVRGILHILPNGGIDKVSNMSYGWSGYVFDIRVDYKNDTEDVIKALFDAGELLRKEPHLRAKIIAPLEIFGVDQFTDSAYVIKGRIKTIPGAHMEVGRNYLGFVKKVFDEQGIKIPFAQTSVYIEDSKKERQN